MDSLMISYGITWFSTAVTEGLQVRTPATSVPHQISNALPMCWKVRWLYMEE